MSSVIKPNGVEVEGESLIKEAYLEEFQTRLANRRAAAGWEEYTNPTNTILRERLKDDNFSSVPFTSKELDKVISELKADSSGGVDKYPPKLFKKAGKGLR